MSRRFLLLPLGLLLAACVTSEAASGPFFGAGISDGCRTAEARNASFSTETYRDETLFETESSYRAGWRSGYAQCQPGQDATARPEDLGEQELQF